MTESDSTKLLAKPFCTNCRWWAARPAGAPAATSPPFGDCRAEAPIASPIPDKLAGRWPVTRNQDWCGAWSRAETWHRIAQEPVL